MKTTSSGYMFKRAEIWWVRFGVKGKRIACSLDTSDRKIASERRDEMASAMQAKVQAMNWSQKLAAVLSKVDGLASPATPPAAPGAAAPAPSRAVGGLPLADVWPAYVASKKRPSSSPATLDGYQKIWQRFAEWVGGEGVAFLQGVTPSLAEEFAAHIDALRDENDKERFAFTSGTVFKNLSFLRTLWRCLLGSPTPFDGLRSQRHDDVDSARDLTAAEARGILGNSPEDWRTFLTVSALTGARMESVACADAKAVADGCLVMTAKKTRKKHITVEVPLPRNVLALLPKAGPLFPSVCEAYSRQRQDFSNAIAAYMRTIAADNAKGSVSHRSFRHTAETVMGQAGVQQVLVNAILGHSNSKLGSFTAYRHLTKAEKLKAVALVAKHYGIK